MNFQQKFQELQTLDPQNPGAWPTWVRLFVVLVITVIATGGGIYAMVLPLTEDLEREVAQEQTLRSEFERKQRKVAALDAYKQQLKEMERDFGAMLRQLPGKAEVANLLNDISRTRSANNLDEEIFEPQSEIVRDFYAELPNRIVVVGTFHDMARFVSDIAELSRIVTIEQVEISRTGGGGGNDSDAPTELRMSATAKTYRYLDDDELAAQRSSGARRGRR